MSAPPTILRVDPGPEGECSQTGLLAGIQRGLLQPSVPLSAQAAVKLQQQQQQWPGTRLALPRPALLPRCGTLLRSLPVELLYDSRGIALFDQVTPNGASSSCHSTHTRTMQHPHCTRSLPQITHLPEYYLTEAEASILARAGTDIARACVQDGTLMLELGAG